MKELVPYVTMEALKAALPRFEDQYGYERRIAALRHVIKDPELQKADIIAQGAMADTIKEAMKRGDVTRGHDDRVYSVNATGTEINPKTVDTWRKVRKLRGKWAKYWKERESYSAGGLIAWGKAEAVREQAAEQAEDIEDDDIQSGDFREVSKDIDDESVELIFTDPPWDRESLPLYGDIGLCAKRVLRDGGSLLCYGGQRMIPELISMVCDAGLTYYWTCAEFRPEGPHARLKRSGIVATHVPILWFVKGRERFNTASFVHDCISTPKPDKEAHDWQQATECAKYYIEKLTNPGGLVFDPFCGSGTTAIASKLLGRNCITCDMDERTVKIARGRVAECQA